MNERKVMQAPGVIKVTPRRHGVSVIEANAPGNWAQGLCLTPPADLPIGWMLEVGR